MAERESNIVPFPIDRVQHSRLKQYEPKILPFPEEMQAKRENQAVLEEFDIAGVAQVLQGEIIEDDISSTVEITLINASNSIYDEVRVPTLLIYTEVGDDGLSKIPQVTFQGYGNYIHVQHVVLLKAESDYAHISARSPDKFRTELRIWFDGECEYFHVPLQSYEEENNDYIEMGDS